MRPPVIFVHFTCRRAALSATCSLWFPLHMRVDAEKTAEQRLATFQKHEAKSPFTHSDLRLCVLVVAAPLPNHLRLRSPKTERGCRNWNYLCMIDFSNLLSFLKTKNFENAGASFMQRKQMITYVGRWEGRDWVLKSRKLCVWELRSVHASLECVCVCVCVCICVCAVLWVLIHSLNLQSAFFSGYTILGSSEKSTRPYGWCVHQGSCFETGIL